MSISRTYLINALTGEEMKSHPLNGKTWNASSGWAYRDGEFIRGTAHCVTVCDYSDLRKVIGATKITPDLFGHPVVVKTWHGKDRDGKPQYDWRYLVAENHEFTELDHKRAARCEFRSNF